MYLDTNIILRFILNDNKELSQKARDLILNNECSTTYEVIAEVVYVLYGVYKIERGDIEKALLSFLPNVTVENTETLKNALHNYSETKLDFVDCLLAAYHIVEKNEILTFDKKLNNFMKRKETDSE
ncbi:PIN domain-containing protein [Treponema zioleckii]|uniref:PIN domain-containing protein n=1 Tax=Treponema zioleckii TaxID=331680 RepID=UPI0018D72072|nr:PIN domain-containing protein [Treponema zioleckii]